MLASVHTYTLSGIKAHAVRVEVDLATCTIPSLHVVGLPDIAVRESRERVRAALRNQQLKYPNLKVTINLAPADLPKAGVGFDLPIAIGLLVASGQAPPEYLSKFVFAGELSLEGKIQPIRGCLSMAISESLQKRQRHLVLPKGNGAEAAAVGEVPVHEVASLREVVALLFRGPAGAAPVQAAPEPVVTRQTTAGDLADVRGQPAACRALEVAAAGSHNLLFIGSPGTGKSMLAERLSSILPPMSRPESLAATAIHSAAGLLPPGSGLLRQRPFRAPHHSVSTIGLIGGGRPPRPGEISLAHRGVLFLDELPEFARHTLESLRQPLESGAVTISRAGVAVSFPCGFQFIAAMNPCPCGRRLDRKGGCRCTPNSVARYLGRVSGPLLDRIDIQMEMASVGFSDMTRLQATDSSLTVASRVAEALERQRHRFRHQAHILNNAAMGLSELQRHCVLGDKPLGLLRIAVSRLGLSPRAFHRVQRLSRTIADLADSETITEDHIAEAISYRLLDRGLFLSCALE